MLEHATGNTAHGGVDELEVLAVLSDGQVGDDANDAAVAAFEVFGLGTEQLALHYQPQVGPDGQVIGMESLLRWTHPERGPISPGDFIPIAEHSRLIVPLGQWVLRAACTQLAAWAADPVMERLTLSVNVSAVQLRHPEVVEQIAAFYR